MKTHLPKNLQTAGMLALVGTITACSDLKSEFYPGEKMVITKEDLSDETVWQFNENTYYVHRIESNSYVAATLVWDNGKKEYGIEAYPLVLSEMNDHMFLSALGEDNLYSILRAVPAFDGDTPTFLLHHVFAEQLRKDIKAGKVQAEEIKGSFHLQGTKEEQDDYILNHIDSIFPVKQVAFARMILDKKKEQKTDRTCPECKRKPEKGGAE